MPKALMGDSLAFQMRILSLVPVDSLCSFTIAEGWKI